ncbi:MAG: hypothetical protein GY953_42835, partial [bacterium]|nr:hypothetical protein [bacterium]
FPLAYGQHGGGGATAIPAGHEAEKLCDSAGTTCVYTAQAAGEVTFEADSGTVAVGIDDDLVLEESGGEILTIHKEATNAQITNSSGDLYLKSNAASGDDIYLWAGATGTFYLRANGAASSGWQLAAAVGGTSRWPATMSQVFHTDLNTGMTHSNHAIRWRSSGTYQFGLNETYNEHRTCRDFGPVSAAPTANGACDYYWDTDLNLRCYYDGTDWVQADDWTTVCA